MIANQKNSSAAGMMLLFFIMVNVAILEHAFTVNEEWYWALIFTVPLFIVAAINHKKGKKVTNKST